VRLDLHVEHLPLLPQGELHQKARGDEELERDVGDRVLELEHVAVPQVRAAAHAPGERRHQVHLLELRGGGPEGPGDQRVAGEPEAQRRHHGAQAQHDRVAGVLLRLRQVIAQPVLGHEAELHEVQDLSDLLEHVPVREGGENARFRRAGACSRALLHVRHSVDVFFFFFCTCQGYISG